MVIFQIMLEHIIIITRDRKEHRKWAGVRSNIDSAHFVPTGLSISYPISNHRPSSLKTENSLQNCTVKAMYTTGQYLKIMGGKGGGDAHPRPQPCAPTPCQNMHTVPESYHRPIFAPVTSLPLVTNML